MLKEGLKTKQRYGRLPDLSISTAARFQRANQFARIDKLMSSIFAEQAS